MRRPTRKGGIMPITTTRTGQSDLDSSSRNVPAASPHTQSINRRRLIVRGGAIAAAAAAFPAPAIAQGVRELKMVTSWPKGLPGLGTSAGRLGRSITEITRGRLQVQVFGAGELVSAFEAFDAVSSGVADMYHAILLGEEVPGLQLLYGCAIRFHRRRDGGLDSLWRRTTALGRAGRWLQNQAGAGLL